MAAPQMASTHHSEYVYLAKQLSLLASTVTNFFFFFPALLLYHFSNAVKVMLLALSDTPGTPSVLISFWNPRCEPRPGLPGAA